MFADGKFDALTKKLLEECCQDVWDGLDPAARARRTKELVEVISSALMALAEAGQTDQHKLIIYARSKAQDILQRS